MILTDTHQFDRMLRLGVDVIKTSPSIARTDFLVALALAMPGAVMNDWRVGEDILELFAYVAPGTNFAGHRTFWVATNATQERNIRGQLVLEFSTGTVGRLAMLNAQRDNLVIQRNTISDLIQLVLDPWRDAPPPGTPPEILDLVSNAIQVKRNERDSLNFLIGLLDGMIAGLGG